MATRRPQGTVAGTRTDVQGGTGRVAVPRQGPAPRSGGGSITVPRGRTDTYYTRRQRGYTYYPRSSYYYPYSIGFGPAGRGYYYFDGYYDSYVWHPRTVVRYHSYGSYGYPTGELRLRVRPRDAQVFVDGYYAGVVDDFDGTFQGLRLEEGPYLIEIVLPGYEPLAFDVRILPGEKITYRGELLRERAY